MQSHASVLVLLCTYNEAENLPQVVAQVWQALPSAHILVIDDNSPDGTSHFVRGHGDLNQRLFLLSRAGKQGLGTALKAGIGWFLERDYQYLVNLDADLSHPPAALPALWTMCDQQGCDVAVGTRYAAGGGFDGLSWHRQWMSRLLNAYASRVLRLPLTDCSGSFRCYGRSILRRLELADLHCQGYGFLEEILVHLHAQGAKFGEVPFIFSARSHGRSKLTINDALGALAVIHRLAPKR